MTQLIDDYFYETSYLGGVGTLRDRHPDRLILLNFVIKPNDTKMDIIKRVYNISLKMLGNHRVPNILRKQLRLLNNSLLVIIREVTIKEILESDK